MTAYNPPLYSFTNLNFNPTIFETGQTVPASSNSSSTFPTGINTDSIQPISVGDTIALYDTSTGTINFGNNSTTRININSQYVRIDGSSNALMSIGGSITSNGIYIGGNISRASPIYIGSGANTTSGSATILQSGDNNAGDAYICNGINNSGTTWINSRTYNTGITNINVGSNSSGAVNIGNGTSATGAITIGNTTNTNKIGSVIIIGNNFSTPAVSDSVVLFNNLTTGSLKLGTSLTSGKLLTIGTTTNTNIIGGVNIINQDIEPQATGSAMTIGNSLTGTLNIGNSTNVNYVGGMSITGQLVEPKVLGTATTICNTLLGSLSIAGAQFAGTKTTIGNTANTNQIGGVSIINQAVSAVAAGTATTLFNNLTAALTIGTTTNSNQLGGVNITAQTITPANPAADMTICNNQTTGNLVIGTAAKTTNLNGQVAVNGALSINAGFNFNKGSLTGGTYFIQTGTYSSTTSIATNATRIVALNFPVAFKASTTPIITITSNDIGAVALICSSRTVSNSNFSCCFFNSGPAATGANAYGMNYIAIGEYA